ncbi:hypothetical protein [Streptomyces violens]|uniref:hypothetical protein n=1 Tax=Streptomyces violens TaxID=66377 RepID=UPI0004C2905D|nr:hypothetical protein [Streptomyces violens]
MLTWVEGVLYGAGGGLVVEAVVTFGRLHAWQQARHAARAAAEALPQLGTYIDPPADALAALFRIVLGGAAGWLLHGELAGVFAAVAVGASAPAVLAQMGSATTVAEALQAGAAPGSAPGSAPGAVPATAPTAPVPPPAAASPTAPVAPGAAPATPVAPAPTQPGPPGLDQAQGEATP